MTTHRAILVALLIAIFVDLRDCTAQDKGAAVAAAKMQFVIPDTDDSLVGVGPMRRADWFRNIWNSRRIEFTKRADQDQRGIVFFGDSITQGWGTRLDKSFSDMKVANRGISGDTTRGMLNRLQDDVLALHPTGIVLLMGTNDLEENAEPELIAQNVQTILDEIRKQDRKLPVVLCLVMPSSGTKHRPADKIKQLNRLYAEIAKKDPHVTVLDTWSLFANREGDAKVEEFPDLLHPNAAGYAKWTDALRPVFATLEFTETEDDAFMPEDGFESLFNGKDLAGWGYRPTSQGLIDAVEKWKKSDPNTPSLPVVVEAMEFGGANSTPDGRFVAKHGRLVVTAPIEGRRIQQLSTTKDFTGDLELRLEFRALPMADSGVFIRGPQLQCRDYVTAGPYSKLTKYRPQQWNELVIVVRNNVAHCTCNGEILEAALKVSASGPIGVEGDRDQIEYRRIRIKMLD